MKDLNIAFFGGSHVHSKILKKCKKLGANGYEEAYTRAGQMMVDKGKDFYWDNPFEVQAEKYAEKNVKKYIKKLNF